MPKSTTTKKTTGERKPRAVSVEMLERKIATLQRKKEEIEELIAQYQAEVEEKRATQTEQEKKRELTKTLLEKLSVEELQALLDKSKS